MDTTKEYREAIGQIYLDIIDLKCKIDSLTDEAMKKFKKEIPYKDRITGEKLSNLFDDAQWFVVSNLWDCPDSPVGLCLYHKIHDPKMECCAYCGKPFNRG